MVDFINKIDHNDQKDQTNETIIDDHYKSNFLFTMKEFVSFE